MSNRLLATVTFIFLSLDLLAQATCDPALPGVKESTVGYRSRGDRCEGLYINPVSSTTLLVASFTEYFEDYNNSSNTLLIEWDKPPVNGEIHLRAQGIKPRLYYRMDAYKPGTTNFFAWSSGVLNSLNLKRNDIGVIGRMKLPVGNTERHVYLPLRIRQEGEVKKSSTYKLILVPGVQLSEIYLSFASVDTNGNPAEFIKTDEALGYGYYPAERAVEISIAAPGKKGIFYLKLGTRIRSGGTKTVEFWFYNP